jgi:hypothetical protein
VPGTLTQTTFAAPSFIAPMTSGTIIKAYAYARTAPTTQAIIIDINLNGATIWATQGNRLTIAASANSGTTSTFDTVNVVETNRFDIDIDQIGTGTVGSDLTVELKIQI